MERFGDLRVSRGNGKGGISLGETCVTFINKLIFHGLWQGTLARSSTLMRRREVTLDQLK